MGTTPLHDALPSTGRAATRLPGRAPVRVVDLDLDDPAVLRAPGGPSADARDGCRGAPVLALVRLHGHPLGLVTVNAPDGGTAELRRELLAAAHRELRVPALSTATPAARPGRVGRARVPAGPVTISVVVTTHDRADPLRPCLDSLLRNGHPRYEVIVVDGTPAGGPARRPDRDRKHGRVRRPGAPADPAHAHRLGLAAARGGIVAFTDAGTLADPGWLAALAAAFAADGRIGAVTGLVLPAGPGALAATARAGSPGPDFAARTRTLADPPFPFAAAGVGAGVRGGVNLAFRTRLLRDLGGFAHGGDDLLAVLRVLAAGHALAHAPDALVWDLRGPAPAHALGRGTHLAAALAREPVLLSALFPALLSRLPGGLRYAARRVRTTPDPDAADRLGRVPLRRTGDPGAAGPGPAAGELHAEGRS
ncbi:glycosyltransferase [Kitasatospora sp. NPDC056327]|uniref:glycosyltransferase family A protein n=1 Tax=Kitasatospora sp. NPDC056327 TaxID=3345785 RepID=UPI0035DEBB49